MKPTEGTVTLIAAMHLVRANLHMVRAGYSPHIDPKVEAVDEAIRAYIESVYESHEEGAFENIELSIWKAVLNGS